MIIIIKLIISNIKNRLNLHKLISQIKLLVCKALLIQLKIIMIFRERSMLIYNKPIYHEDI